jgi:hypothetical protein
MKDKGKDFNIDLAVKTRIISDGLRYFLPPGQSRSVSGQYYVREHMTF